MSSFLAVPQADSRPAITRTRSSSSPIEIKEDEKSQPVKASLRPGHVRSRSYILPTEAKLLNSVSSLAAAGEKLSDNSLFNRLHLSGRHNHHQNADNDDAKPTSRSHHSRHKYTQSDAQHYHRKRNSALYNNASPDTPVPASSASERSNELLYPASRGSAIPSLMRMSSTRSHHHRGRESRDLGGHPETGVEGKPSYRRRASSDPRLPVSAGTTRRPNPTPKSPIELDLERADFRRRAAKENATEADLKRKDIQLNEASEELEERVTTTTRSASDLMRRLDDAQDTLFRTTESLLDTISSFSNLSEQSSSLIANFEYESKNFDQEIRQRIFRFRNSLAKNRTKRVEELEKRGQAISRKAEELGRRLENCRTIVTNWESRETNKRKAWRGVWVGILWGVCLIVIAVLAGVVSWKAAEIRRGGGTPAEKLWHMTVDNKSYDSTVLRSLEIPDNVKDILIDIEARTREGRVREQPLIQERIPAADGGKESRGFRLLDEL